VFAAIFLFIQLLILLVYCCFNKGLSAEDIKFYGKIHFNRNRSNNKLNMHCHLIVSRKDQSNKVKISPLTNHRNTKKGAIKGSFDRTSLFENAEKGFDRLFGYHRQLSETFEYCNTMKNGSVADQLKMRERELKITDDSTSVQQQVNTSVNLSTTESTKQSFGFDSAGYFLSIFPSGEDIDNNANVENEQQLRKPKRKRKRRRRIS